MMQNRTYTLPNGFSIRTLPPADNYTDADINFLYNMFSCCFADKNYVLARKAIKGLTGKCCSDCEIDYLSMGLKALQGWYTPNPTAIPASCTFTTLNTRVIFGGGNTAGASIYLTPDFKIPTSEMTLLATTSGQTSWANVGTVIVPALAALGFTFTSVASGSNSIVTITAPAVYGNITQYIYMNTTLAGGGGFNLNYATQLSGGKDVFNPCMSADNINKIIENMMKICGCVDCQNITQVEDDTIYIPIGQQFSNPPLTVAQINP
jgi:hypothetical protein